MAGSKQKQKEIPEKNYENKYILWGTLAAFLVSVFVLTSFKLEDDDVFWHLSTGKFIVENKYVPDKDVFGFSTQDAEWIPFEWGSDVITYSLYGIGGYNALSVFRSIIFCIFFYIYFRLLQKFKVNNAVIFIFLLVLLFGIFDRLSPRPHMFTYLFMVILLYMLLTYKFIDREKYFKRLYFLPLIFLVWGNLHLGVIAGGTVLFIFVLAEATAYFRGPQKNDHDNTLISKDNLKKLVIISAASALVLFINPHGIQTYIYAYGHTKMKMLESIMEWQNPFTGKIDSTFVLVIYKVLLFSGALVLIYAYKKKNMFAALLYIAFVIYSVRAIRFTVDYEIIMMFFIAMAVNYYLERLLKAGKSGLNFRYVNVMYIILAAAFLLVSYNATTDNLYFTLKYNRHFGWGIYENLIPVKLYDFMSENKISGIPFNNFETGGYLVWKLPGEKNFIDSRNINDDIFNEYMSILYMDPGFEKKFDKYGFDYAIYFDPQMAKYPNKMKQLITAYLSRNENWKLVYWDDESMLFLKNVPKFSGLISKYEYKVFNPFTAVHYMKEFESNCRNYPDAVVSEMKRKTDTDKNGYYFSGMSDIAWKVMRGK